MLAGWQLDWLLKPQAGIQLIDQIGQLLTGPSLHLESIVQDESNTALLENCCSELDLNSEAQH